MEKELLPLSTVLAEIEKRIGSGDPIPDFGTLTAWAAGEAERMGSPAGRKAGKGLAAAEISIKMEGKTSLLIFEESHFQVCISSLYWPIHCFIGSPASAIV